jgi:hypothetical protein
VGAIQMNRLSPWLLESIDKQNATVVSTKFYILNFILHPKAGDSKASTEGTSAALTLRNKDGALSKLADSAAGE